MAKKKTIQDGIVEETVSEMLADEMPAEAPVIPRDEDEGVMIEALLPTYVPSLDEPELNVSFTLPRAVLMALIDPEHPEASGHGAVHFGLLGAAVGELSPIGEKVLAGCDQTALRHQMATAWRTAYNAALEPNRMEKA